MLHCFRPHTKELLSTFQRPFSVHGGWEHFGKEKTDRALNDLHQQKFKNSQSADFLFIPITAQEERRSNKVKVERKSSTTGSDLYKTDLDKAKEISN